MNLKKINFFILVFLLSFNVYGGSEKTIYISNLEVNLVTDSLSSELITLKKSHKDLNVRYTSLQYKLDLIDEKLSQSISRESNFISFISWASGIVISVVGLLFGIYSVLMFTGNKRVINESKETLNETKKLKEVFEEWFKIKKKEYQEIIRKDYLIVLERIHNATKLEQLKNLLINKSKDPKEYFPLMSALSSSPLLEYKSYFKQLIELNISEEITALAKKGISDIPE